MKDVLRKNASNYRPGENNGQKMEHNQQQIQQRKQDKPLLV